eukprot:TRINITY_DN74236_c0_g1_i1.p1 TRINITY_DN74236_c0_g1~~TRINITY_DN74236_c0_g1_i1.p1  ORF type:complete len:880 (-),score=173.58 TRINITY_DN74236_c0_g1_i1:314-2890(-)
MRSQLVLALNTWLALQAAGSRNEQSAGCGEREQCRASGVLSEEQVLLQASVRSQRHSEVTSLAVEQKRARVAVSGRQVLVDGRPVHIKGVNWNPIPKGKGHPWGLDYKGYVERDGDLMKAAGINAIRTYEPLTDRQVLDALHERGIWVVNTVYAYGGTDTSAVPGIVNAVKDHPAILMWAVGNEWNYNGFYTGLSGQEQISRVREVTELVKQHDKDHPVSTVYGEVPTTEVLSALSNVDVWALNVYRGKTFGDLFDTWASRSGKPMYIGEFGADAFNANINAEDEVQQADATRELTREINAHTAVTAGGVCMGGIIFEFADEWWKDGNGPIDVQDTGGVAPGGGPWPDFTFNEEWWGLVDIERKTRLAYSAYAAEPVPSAGQGGGEGGGPAPSPAPTDPEAPSCLSAPPLLHQMACPAEHFGGQLLNDPTLESPTGGWKEYRFKPDGADYAYGSPGLVLNVKEDGDDTIWHVQLVQDVELERSGGGGDYEICVQAGAAEAGGLMQLSVDGGAAGNFATAGMTPRTRMQLPVGSLETACFKFSLSDAAQPYIGRAAMEFGRASGQVAVCQASLRRCSGAAMQPTVAPTQEPPVSPTALPTPSPTTPPTAAPTPEAPPTTTAAPPSPSAHGFFVWDTCGDDFNLQGNQVLYSVAGYGFEGEEIRIDAGVKLCQDCGKLCALEMGDQCVGYEWKETVPNSLQGECTYYSRIDRAVARDERFVAVAKTQQSGTSLPPATTPAPATTPGPTNTPTLFSTWQSCNERFGLQGSKALQRAAAHKLTGTEIRTDGGVRICEDCAQRCALQQPSTCKGFAFTPTTADGSSGKCTYYSRIDDIVAAEDSDVAIVLAEHIAAAQVKLLA